MSARRYEAMFILETEGKDYGVNEMITRLTSELQSLGAQLEDVQKMDKRPFARVTSRKHTSGYYVVFTFQGEPDLPEKIRRHFLYDPDVFRLRVYRLPEKKETAESKAS